MGLFSKKNNDTLKFRSKEMVERSEFRGNAIANLVLPDTVRIVAEDAFRECRSLKTVTLSQNVCELGAYAFRDCDALESIVFPEEMRYPDGSNGEIGIGCFDGCGLLRHLIIPEGVAVIHANAFHNCAALEYVKLPRTLRAIRSGAFSGCARLEKLDMPVIPELIAADAFVETPHHEYITGLRKPVLTVMHTSSFGLPEIYQFAAVPRLIGVEQTEREMSVVLDACDEERISFRITRYTHAGGSHTIPKNEPTRLFHEEYDCNGGAGLQTEEILASYR